MALKFKWHGTLWWYTLYFPIKIDNSPHICVTWKLSSMFVTFKKRPFLIRWRPMKTKALQVFTTTSIMYRNNISDLNPLYNVHKSGQLCSLTFFVLWSPELMTNWNGLHFGVGHKERPWLCVQFSIDLDSTMILNTE